MNSNIYRIALAAQRKVARWSWLGDDDIEDIKRVGAGKIPTKLSQDEYRRRAAAQNEIANNAQAANRWQALQDYGTMARNVAGAATIGAAFGPDYLPGGVFLDPGIKALIGGAVGVGKGIYDIKGKRSSAKSPEQAPAPAKSQSAPQSAPATTPTPKEPEQPALAQGRN